MSFKSEAYKTFIHQPAGLHNYVVLFLGAGVTLGAAPLLVESMGLPTEKWNEEGRMHMGEKVYFRTQSDVQGTWNCVIPDSSMMQIRNALMDVKEWDARSSFDVFIWPVNLGGLIPAKDSFGSVGGAISAIQDMGAIFSSLMTGTLLKDCRIMNIGDVKFNASNPTGIVKWNLDVRYQAQAPLIKKPTDIVPPIKMKGALLVAQIAATAAKLIF